MLDRHGGCKHHILCRDYFHHLTLIDCERPGSIEKLFKPMTMAAMQRLPGFQLGLLAHRPVAWSG